MQLTVTTFLSVDGVYQGPGGPDEDRSDGFDRGGWLVPHFDETLSEFMGGVMAKADAFLIGRRTYEIFAASWPRVTDADDPVGGPLNRLPKYVVSKTLDRAEWNNSTIIGGDVPAEVARLKGERGRELQVHGSGALVRTLLADDLVDEMRLIVFPVIVGAGRRLFPDAGQATGLELAESRTTPRGVAIHVYRPRGRPEFGEVELT